MSNIDSVNNFFEALTERASTISEGCDVIKTAYITGYVKGLLIGYVPQEVIDRHFEHVQNLIGNNQL